MKEEDLRKAKEIQERLEELHFAKKTLDQEIDDLIVSL